MKPTTPAPKEPQQPPRDLRAENTRRLSEEIACAFADANPYLLGLQGDARYQANKTSRN